MDLDDAQECLSDLLIDNVPSGIKYFCLETSQETIQPFRDWRRTNADSLFLARQALIHGAVRCVDGRQLEKLG